VQTKEKEKRVKNISQTLITTYQSMWRHIAQARGENFKPQHEQFRDSSWSIWNQNYFS
jgi:hypothetical protein